MTKKDEIKKLVEDINDLQVGSCPYCGGMSRYGGYSKEEHEAFHQWEIEQMKKRNPAIKRICDERADAIRNAEKYGL
jgi:hypothetical protein